MVVFLLILLRLLLFGLFKWYKSVYVGFYNDCVNWVSCFECGFIRHGLSERVFSHNCLLLMVIFIVFDLEVSLLLKVPFQGLWYGSYLYYTIFLCLVGLGYCVEVYRGLARWDN